MTNHRHMKHELKLEHTKVIPTSTLLKPIIVGILLTSTSLFFWTIASVTSDSSSYKDDNTSTVSPFRWFFSLLVPVVISYKAIKKQSLDTSGAIFGFFIGFILTLTNYGFMASLLFFFISSSWATHYRSDLKKKIEENFKIGGQRNWIQVICNGGVAAYFGMIYYLETGSGEFTIDFHRSYRRSWIILAIISSIACSTGDTWASELGTVLTKANPRLIINWKPVPRGTNGGITIVGTLCSALGGLLVGFTYYFTSLLCLDSRILENSISQWPIIFTGLFGGLMGSLIDSFLGATCQYSGVNESTGEIANQPHNGVSWICGIGLLDNHSVNFLSSLCTAFLGAHISVLVWSWI